MILAFTVIGISCSNDGIFPTLNNDITTLLEREEGGNRFDEFGCIVENCAGTLCRTSIGKSCKKEKPCTPIPGGCLTDKQRILDSLDIFSSQHSNFMLANDYIDTIDWQKSYNLCRSILIDRANSLP